MRIYADLHSHSNASDGSDPPARVVERARNAGLAVLALTDHDTVAGVEDACAAGQRLGVRVLPGVELTCYENGREIHLLGYGVRTGDEALLEHCRRFQEARIARAREIGERLAACGAPIDMDRVMSEADGGVVGRPHVARALVEAGHVADFQEAFDKFLAEGRPACVSKLDVDPRACIDIVRRAGGVAVVAHPALGNLYDLLPGLIDAGAIGIEVWHSAHDADAVERLNLFTLDRGLARTGGSDCHGATKGADPLLAQFGLNRSQWEKFEKVLAENGVEW